MDLAFAARSRSHRLRFAGLVADGGDQGHLVALPQAEQLGVEQDRDRAPAVGLRRHRDDEEDLHPAGERLRR